MDHAPALVYTDNKTLCYVYFLLLFLFLFLFFLWWVYGEVEHTWEDWEVNEFRVHDVRFQNNQK